MGDGTVPIKSLEACGNWKDVKMKAYKFGGSLAAHTSISTHKPLLQDIMKWIDENFEDSQASNKFIPIIE